MNSKTPKKSTSSDSHIETLKGKYRRSTPSRRELIQQYEKLSNKFDNLLKEKESLIAQEKELKEKIDTMDMEYKKLAEELECKKKEYNQKMNANYFDNDESDDYCNEEETDGP